MLSSGECHTGVSDGCSYIDMDTTSKSKEVSSGLRDTMVVDSLGVKVKLDKNKQKLHKICIYSTHTKKLYAAFIAVEKNEEKSASQ